MNKTTRIFSLLLLFVLLLPHVARLQTLSYLGTKTPYPSPSKKAIAKAPAGYQPVFINYTGRHGSRFMTKAGADVVVVQVLVYAAEQNALTELGKKLKVMADEFLELQKTGYENITLLGAAEQQAIGERLFKNYPSAFTGKGIDIFTTYKVRTQQSAEAFQKGLADYTGEKHVKTLAEGQDDVLRFYDLSSNYQDFKKSSSLKKKTDSLQNDPRTTQTASRTCSRIFTPAFTNLLMQKGLKLEDKNKSMFVHASDFVQALFEVYTMQFSLPLEIRQKGYSDIDFSGAFDKGDLAWLDFVSGAQDFLEKGAGTDTLGLQATVAKPLLADYLRTTQDMIDGRLKADAIFRFTHAEAISPFATLVGIREASHPSASILHYNEHWSAANIIPLSANICWVIYSNGKDYLVKAMLNEKEVALPIKTDVFPFYHWRDVNEYYMQKLRGIRN